MDNVELILVSVSIPFVTFAIFISIFADKNLPICYLSGDRQKVQRIIYSAIMITLGYILAYYQRII